MDTARRNRWLARNLHWILPALAAFALLAKSLSSHGFLGDVGWDVSNGLWMLQHHYIPLKNYLATAMYGAHWGNDEWLWGLYMGVSFKWLGEIGPFIFGLPVMLATSVFIALRLRRVHVYWNLILSLLAALALLPGMSPRPQIASYALFALVLWAVNEDERQSWPLWLAAAMTLVWTNLHGSAILDPLVLGLYGLQQPKGKRRRYAGPFILSALLLLAHPGGLGGTGGLFSTIFSPGNLNVIAEWQSPNFHQILMWFEALALGVGFAVVVPNAWRRRRFADVALVLGASVAMLYAVRFSPYLAILVATAVGEYIPARWLPSMDGEAGRRLLARANLVGGVVAVALLVVAARAPIFPARYPLKVTAYLEAHHAQNVMNYYSIGSTLEPFGIKPFLDGRNDLWLQRAWWGDYLNVVSGQESILTFLHRYDPTSRYVLWYADSPVARTLDSAKGWRRVVTDPNPLDPEAGALGAYVLWTRSGG